MKARLVELNIQPAQAGWNVTVSSPFELPLEGWITLNYANQSFQVQILEIVTNTMTEFYEYKATALAPQLFLKQMSQIEWIASVNNRAIYAQQSLQTILNAAGLSLTWSAQNWMTTAVPVTITEETAYTWKYTINNTSTLDSIINSVISWTQEVPPLKINIVPNGTTLQFIQRGQETRNLVVVDYDNDVQTYTPIKPFFEGNNESTLGQQGVTDGTPFSGYVGFGNKECLYQRGLLIMEQIQNPDPGPYPVPYLFITSKNYQYSDLGGYPYLTSYYEIGYFEAGSSRGDMTVSRTIYEYTKNPFYSKNNNQPMYYLTYTGTTDYAKYQELAWWQATLLSNLGPDDEKVRWRLGEIYTVDYNPKDVATWYIPLGQGFFGQSTQTTTVSVPLSSSVSVSFTDADGKVVSASKDLGTKSSPINALVPLQPSPTATTASDTYKQIQTTITTDSQIMNGFPGGSASILSKQQTAYFDNNPSIASSTLLGGNYSFTIDARDTSTCQNVLNTLEGIQNMTLEIVSLSVYSFVGQSDVNKICPTYFDTITWLGNLYYINSVKFIKKPDTVHYQIEMERWY